MFWPVFLVCILMNIYGKIQLKWRFFSRVVWILSFKWLKESPNTLLRLNLEHLKLYNRTNDCNLMEPAFGQLKSLRLFLCNFMGNANKLFGNCLQLEKIDVYGLNDVNFMAQRFPKLQDFVMSDYKTSMRYEIFREFLTLNPH